MKDLKTDLVFLGLLFTAFTLSFELMLNNIAIILALLPALYGLVTDRLFRQRLWGHLKHNKIALVMMAFALFYAVSAAIHWRQYHDINALLKHLEMRLPFLLLPVPLALVPEFNHQQIKRLWQALVAGILLSAALLLLGASWVSITTGSLYNLHPRYGMPEHNFMYHRLGSYLGLHAVYYSAMILLAFVLTMVFIRFRFAKARGQVRFFMIITLAFWLLMLFLLKSAAILLALIFIVVSYGMYLLYQYRTRMAPWQRWSAALVILALVGIMGERVIDKVGHRGSIFKYDFLQPGGGEWNVFNLRKAKWDVATEVIADHWLWGTGPARAQQVLDDYYARHLFINALQHHYNAHNQFLQTFLTLGLPGFLLLLYMYGASFYRAVKRTDLVWFLFILGFTLFSISESTLEVNKGIVLFTFVTLLCSFLPDKVAVYFNG